MFSRDAIIFTHHIVFQKILGQKHPSYGWSW